MSVIGNKLLTHARADHQWSRILDNHRRKVLTGSSKSSYLASVSFRVSFGSPLTMSVSIARRRKVNENALCLCWRFDSVDRNENDQKQYKRESDRKREGEMETRRRKRKASGNGIITESILLDCIETRLSSLSSTDRNSICLYQSQLSLHGQRTIKIKVITPVRSFLFTHSTCLYRQQLATRRVLRPDTILSVAETDKFQVFSRHQSSSSWTFS